MRIKIDNNISIKVTFDVFDREEGYEDDIRFAISETGPQEFRIFKADTTSFLLTPDQAEKLAIALQQAVQKSRNTP